MTGATARQGEPPPGLAGALGEEADARRRMAIEAGRRVAATIGDIFVVLARDPQYRARSLAEIEAQVFPAVVAGRYALAYSDRNPARIRTPIAVLLWTHTTSAAEPGRGEQDMNSGDAVAVTKSVIVMRSGPATAIDALAAGIAGSSTPSSVEESVAPASTTARPDGT